MPRGCVANGGVGERENGGRPGGGAATGSGLDFRLPYSPTPSFSHSPIRTGAHSTFADGLLYWGYYAHGGNGMVLSKLERLHRAARGLEVDRVPSLGGWTNGAANLAALAGISLEAYLREPMRGVVQANVALDVDAMVMPVVPTSAEQIRSGSVEEHRYAGIEPEALLEHAATLPDDERGVLATVDAAAEEAGLRRYFEDAFATWEGIQPLPNFWDMGGTFPLYFQFGYTAFFAACAMYPEAVGHIWWARSVRARERAKLLLPLYKEYNLVPILFCGEDLCTNRGPMLAPAMLRERYFPTVKMIIEPLVDAGIRVVHHCDGDVRPVLGDFLGCGFSGFQGFQYEDGLDIYDVRKLRSARGEEPLIFAGLSVTRTLPWGTPDDVRAEVDYFLDATDGGRGMFLFSSNVTGVEVPVENIQTAYHYVKTWDPAQPRPVSYPAWPWGVSHPEE